MKKVSHESPLDLLDFSGSYNDYDYALVHLFEKSEEYYIFFKDSLKMGREVILDNSIFELGKSWDPDDFIEWVNKLNPTYYIIPDVLNNAEETIERIREWRFDRIKGDSEAIAVVQGETYESVVECYRVAQTYAQKIAFSFDYKLYERMFDGVDIPVEWKWMFGRIDLLNRLLDDGVIDQTMPHHLLGVGLPQEMLAYKDSRFNWIESVDTSNPVVHGMRGIPYMEWGLGSKDKTKLADLFEEKVSFAQVELIKNNVRIFRSFL